MHDTTFYFSGTVEVTMDFVRGGSLHLRSGMSCLILDTLSPVGLQ